MVGARRLGALLVAGGVLAAAALADVGKPGEPSRGFVVPPAPARFVHDGADLLPPAEERQLEERVLELDRQTGVQIAVATFPTLAGETVEGATLAIAETWKVGHRGKDDGVILAVYMAERKMRIEVGYGLEGQLPDATASRIIAEQVSPRFRQGDFAQGLVTGVEAIAAAATGAALPAPYSTRAPRASRPGGQVDGGFILCCVAPVILWSLLSSVFMRRRRSRTFGRGYATGGMPWWAWLLIGQSMSRPNRHHGGGWGGGGGFGGGGGGGGFGGGSFGGGGASGSW